MPPKALNSPKTTSGEEISHTTERPEKESTEVKQFNKVPGEFK